MDVRDDGSSGLRGRTRRAVRAEIGAAAMRLFLERGFEATTMEEIANEVGISRRSLFRYFGTKEDIVLGNHAEQGLVVKAALEARPASEGPWEALRAALKTLFDDLAYSPEDFLKITRMLHETPSLRARHLEKQRQWLDLLVPNVAERLGTTPDTLTELRARAIVASALACVETATESWVQRDGDAEIERIYDEAVAAIRR
jgi:AcrR family transcriptional regulator